MENPQSPSKHQINGQENYGRLEIKWETYNKIFRILKCRKVFLNQLK
jgi:hypothetical protein